LPVFEVTAEELFRGLSQQRFAERWITLRARLYRLLETSRQCHFLFLRRAIY